VKANSRATFDNAWTWYQTGPLQRLMPNGAIVVIMTRWSLLDLTGRLLKYQVNHPEAEPWEIVELPAILFEDTEREKSLWPEQWPLKELKAKKNAMDAQYWNAQYMQKPTSEGAALVKRSDWRVWEKDDPPPCEFVIQAWDTAFEEKQTANYSAVTTWGVWYNEEEGNQPQIILLDAFRERMAFPALKAKAYDMHQEWKPDAFIIEKKAAGAPLIQELRAMGIPVEEFTPSRGQDKVVRMNAVTDIFASGMVWAPDRRWAKDVIEEVAAFPQGENDDFVDTTTLALMRFRSGGFIRLPSDEPDPPTFFRRRRGGYY
jgi:predicted phage terminase large subunit-like protein